MAGFAETTDQALLGTGLILASRLSLPAIIILLVTDPNPRDAA
jgi:hypothetical protein